MATVTAQETFLSTGPAQGYPQFMSRGAWIAVGVILGLCLADDIYYGIPPRPPQPTALSY